MSAFGDEVLAQMLLPRVRSVPEDWGLTNDGGLAEVKGVAEAGGEWERPKPRSVFPVGIHVRVQRKFGPAASHPPRSPTGRGVGRQTRAS